MSKKRPPIIVVMGHVDHGKSKLIDYIRKTNVVDKEAGGITQAIGAYEIEHVPTSSKQKQKITFIDTPGHEAFSKMRSHGASVADLAILIVAADDGVKPQTKEALECIKEAKIPFVVAINKIDKPEANVEKTKNELLQAEVLLEGMGGNVSYQEISAKEGTNVDELLDLILLTADLEELTYDPDAEPEGIVMTNSLDPQRGILTGIVLKNGVLKKGQYAATDCAKGKIKILEDCHSKSVEQIEPSAPALIVGLDCLSESGEILKASDKPLRTSKTSKTTATAPTNNLSEQTMRLVLKADEVNSLEALKSVGRKLSEKHNLCAISATVGNITENDIKIAISSNAIVAGFNTKVDKAAENLAKVQKIKIITSNIIYELEKQILEHNRKINTENARVLEVLAVFNAREGKNQIIGGKVIKGAIKNEESFEIWFENKQIGKGKITNLQSGRESVPEVIESNECGLKVESTDPIAVGHKLLFIN